MVGLGGKELVNQITFGAHDLNAVITGTLRQLGAGHEITDLLLDARFIQLFGRKRVDRRLNGARRDLSRAVGVAPGVKDLQADLAAFGVHSLGHDHMFLGLFSRTQLGRPAVHPALVVGRNTAGDHQADAPFGPLGKIGGHALKPARLLFKAGVHRAHQRAVTQSGKAQIQRGEQMGVVRGGHQGCSVTG